MSSGGKNFGANLIAKVAMGSRDKGVLAWKFERLSTWGILRQWTIGELRTLIDALERAGALVSSYESHKVQGMERTLKLFSLSELGTEIMLGRAESFEMVFPHGQKLQRSRPKERKDSSLGPIDSDLLGELKQVRGRLARAADVPAYVVAPNRTLEEIASLRPTTKGGLMTVHGMGKERYRRYGSVLLKTVREWTGG
jgi:ATP-dependent DNA helicase RecQ